jgi:two-component system response regulator LytT
MMVSCMIVDDDPVVVNYLRAFALQIPFLNLVSTHNTPTDALKVLETENVQLIFLDIGMPGINGMEFAKMLYDSKGESAPRIIFISGFDRFALEGYKVNALGYLLKPPTYEDFLKSAYKAKKYFEQMERSSANSYTESDFIFLRVEHDLLRIYLKDILYVEGFKDYVKVYLHNGGLIKALTTMKGIEEKLPQHSFMRVHRSFIISLDKIDAIHNNTVKIGKTMIPVTAQFKDEFKKFVDQWF